VLLGHAHAELLSDPVGEVVVREPRGLGHAPMLSGPLHPRRTP
jgi:hypothetical protein